ncbi:MAG: hypothetical protein A2Y18_01390 [Clostridiales bacterium GWD2_32_19]|nr:MAG: hypothetical protein A2Y18_01390 [Clostridiales bacterium GWD2_32_19]
MARKQRIHYRAALYHVMARGNNGEYIIKDEQDKKHYIDIVKKYKERYQFKLYAYCLMDNHIHMLIEVSEVPLAKIMQGIQQVYTQHYNKKYKRTGHVFQQRYKAVVCNKDGYMLHLVKYIHYNPVKAKIEEGLDYKWSSHREYTKGKGYHTDIESVLKMISKNKTQAIKGYIEYMKGQPDDIEEAEYRVEEAQSNTPRTKEKGLILENMINKIIDKQKITKEELMSGSKAQKISDTRKVIIILASADITNKEVAEKLRISTAAVSRIRAGQYKKTENVKNMVETYSKLIN